MEHAQVPRAGEDFGHPSRGPSAGARLRELRGGCDVDIAVQVQRELMWLYGPVPRLRVECVTGGTPIGPERRQSPGDDLDVERPSGRLD